VARIHPFGLAGHQLLGFTWSNEERFSLIQDPANLASALLTERLPRLANPGPTLHLILSRFFPHLLVPVHPPNMESSTWSMWYSFDQYLWQPHGDPKRGFGIFFTLAPLTGTLIRSSTFTALDSAETEWYQRRPNDNFGVGWARTKFSDDFVPLLRQRSEVDVQARS
jgi:porin